MTPQPGKVYSKVRTSLAERTIQTVRTQGKCLIVFLEDKMKMNIPDGHALHGCIMVHAGWLLNRYHLTSGNGVTAYMVVRGDPTKVVSVHLVRRCTPWTLCNKNINVNGAVDVV